MIFIFYLTQFNTDFEGQLGETNLKFAIVGYLWLQFCVRVVVDYADMQISKLANDYVRENERIRDIVLACSYWAKAESLSKK